ncbi:MAG: MGMT family protein [Anaerolineae bacterium]|nr:MGMT family protein [Anaerolineae bacterium]
MDDQQFFDRVYALVRRIPPGKVASYGQIARMLEHPHAARTVGWALGALKSGAGDVPWFRVVTSQGKVHFAEQRKLLEQEGVVFDVRGQIDMKAFQWEGLAPGEMV